MKKLAWIALAIALTATASAQERITLRLVCDETADLRVAVECMMLLETRVPVKVVIERMPWKRCLEVELNGGSADGAFLASYQASREEFGVYPTKDGKPDADRRYNRAGYFFYRLKGSAVTWDGVSLGNMTRPIGAQRGYSIVEDLRKAGYTVEEGVGTLADLQKLAAGRLDLVAAIEEMADQVLLDYPDLAARIEKVEIPYSAKPYYLMLSHQFVTAHPDLARAIWDAVKSIRENEYLAVYSKYMAY